MTRNMCSGYGDAGVQLNKYLAHAGVTSRRDAVRLIEAGDVRINGEVIKEPGYRVMPGDVVELRGKPIRCEQKVYFLLNKPKDFVTTCADEHGRRTVVSLLAGRIRQRVYPVGRLDRGTTGLLVMTNDGTLANKLAHPRYGVEKRYVVTLDKPLVNEDVLRIRRGVRLFDGVVKVDSLRLSARRQNEATISLHSGKNRVVRRLFEALGYRVRKLDRIAYAGLQKRGLPIGAWRPLSLDEVTQLSRATASRTY